MGITNKDLMGGILMPFSNLLFENSLIFKASPVSATRSARFAKYLVSSHSSTVFRPLRDGKKIEKFLKLFALCEKPKATPKKGRKALMRNAKSR